MHEQPVDGGDDPRGRPATRAAQHAKAAQPHFLRDAEALAADDAGDVRPMPIAVLTVAAKSIVHVSGAPAELRVARVDPGVDDVRGHAGGRRRVAVLAQEWQATLIDAI